MKLLVVFCHPRRSSFTGSVADAFCEGAREAGHEIEFADLYAEGFDPCLREGDEPDWEDPNKRYSGEVRAEMARVERAEAIVFVCPIWWWSVPAMLKGWIDRVWNLGWAYGTAKLPHSHALLIGTAAASSDAFAKRGYDQAFETQFNTGILDFCGIDDGRIELLHETTSNLETRKELLKKAQQIGAQFPAKP